MDEPIIQSPVRTLVFINSSKHTLHGIQYLKSLFLNLFFSVLNIETANAGEMQAEVVTAQYIQLIIINANHKRENPTAADTHHHLESGFKYDSVCSHGLDFVHKLRNAVIDPLQSSERKRPQCMNLIIHVTFHPKIKEITHKIKKKD